MEALLLLPPGQVGRFLYTVRFPCRRPVLTDVLGKPGRVSNPEILGDIRIHQVQQTQTTSKQKLHEDQHSPTRRFYLYVADG